ncbi:acyl-homoserine-lactone synthase [Erwinia sp. HR93]|uniref:acyl-homoserine-lactone synthase n=1 Tax=Erwinia sp. HR93 TaxID=3094840 RepID=UPI002ADEEAD4|nr:acyl-homoserine-lactone synthase [Erwinia sp. HR93]MEA1064439.1 acyl-homoserine-lactone synthase [Erwinia sp. HR93]
MLKFLNVSYGELSEIQSEELYQLRKKTFYDRLNWEVSCQHEMEIDEFDTPDARYILGILNGDIICSVRFLQLAKPNMITHTFNKNFSDVPLPAEGVETSRFFVDKHRAKAYLGDKYPISNALLLSMINYARSENLAGIYTIVSRAMVTILKRSGWPIKILKESRLKADEFIYLLYLPTDTNSQNIMARKVAGVLDASPEELSSWPMHVPLMQDLVL